jgi:CRP/FNR family transcriptional regulator
MLPFIRSDNFLRLLAKHPEMHQGVVKQPTTLYNGAWQQLRTVGLSASVPEKVARLLLDWAAEGKLTKTGTQITLPLTHEAIAAFVGTTRETVTRKALTGNHLPPNVS